MKGKHVFLSLLLVGLLGSCEHKSVETKVGIEHLSWGYAIAYGDYYQRLGVESDVLSLHLFSRTLQVDSTGSLAGEGTYLCFSDIFVAPKQLVLSEGDYAADTTCLPSTFLCGQAIQNTHTGSYLLNITSTGVQYTVFPKGRFTCTLLEGDSVRIEGVLTDADGATYSPYFQSVLPIYDGRRQSVLQPIVGNE